MASKSGVLICSDKKIEVSFSSLVWFKSHGQAQEIREFWHKQGYAEAIELLFERTSEGLIVRRNLEAFGWAIAGDVCREVYELPF